MSSIFELDKIPESIGQINMEDLYEKKQKYEQQQLDVFNKTVVFKSLNLLDGSDTCAAGDNSLTYLFYTPNKLNFQSGYDSINTRSFLCQKTRKSIFTIYKSNCIYLGVLL